MRQRRVFTTLALILGILALSLAYAAISSQTIDVEGSATAATSDSNFDVKFTGTVTSSGDGTVTGYIDTAKDSTGRTAVINVSNLTTKGQKATACINIINNSEELNAIPTVSNVMNTNTTWYKVSTELGETTYWDSSTQEPILQPGETVELYVTVELLKTPATDADIAAAVDTMTIKVSAQPADADATIGEYGTGGTGGDTTTRIATLCDNNTEPCSQCNQTGLHTGKATLDGWPSGMYEYPCIGCGETTSMVYDMECSAGCFDSNDAFLGICDECYEQESESAINTHNSTVYCWQCFGLCLISSGTLCEEHSTYGLHAYCESCGYYEGNAYSVSQLQHDCI